MARGRVGELGPGSTGEVVLDGRLAESEGRGPRSNEVRRGESTEGRLPTSTESFRGVSRDGLRASSIEGRLAFGVGEGLLDSGRCDAEAETMPRVDVGLTTRVRVEGERALIGLMPLRVGVTAVLSSGRCPEL
jgi:hypothetical protein